MTTIKVKRNKINTQGITWFKLYNISDHRVVGQKGNYFFINYGKPEEFDPTQSHIQEYIDKFTFYPISTYQLHIVPIPTI